MRKYDLNQQEKDSEQDMISNKSKDNLKQE